MPLNTYASRFLTINWSKTYSPKIRMIQHGLMWLALGMLYLSTYNRFDQQLGWIFALKDLSTVMIIFYTISYYVLPELLFKGKILLTVFAGLLCYGLYAEMTYLACFILNQYYLLTPRMKVYTGSILEHGFTGLLSWWALKFYFLDFLYAIAPPIALKLMKSIIDQSNQRIGLERDNLNLQIGFLKAQINPHFLFNTLNNIYRMVNKQDPNTGPMVLHLSDLMRYTLYESNVERILLSRETEFISDYLELEKIRYGKEVSINIHIDQELGNVMIVPLILFPFIENAFKHGPDATVESSWIEISVKLIAGVLHFDVGNSTTTRQPKPDAEFSGVGILNVKKRLEIQYPGKYKLDISSENSVHRVKLILALHER